ncbi:hypothetical protein [Pseudobacteriovorax antillogorgiicola]|uniref:Uncharacterized protein n=1 Tax=Pseudobacteriovorax antillogorgiicola TaxID=1513793 RepID=A0A1Y6BH01_9BACT|nr:hypothetical protein [Pseudobacteriovorax antillogorgiicola]TCS55559.1 hypothetical protein EDD56_105285 [Pseudobacteriovorax antillogorgiicola]SMF10985.1 hypothetical protein SAMN06296036_10539 [Pseudobacteriovorax antillogorgiicola]
MANKGLENTHPIIIKCAAFTTGVTLKSFRAKDVLFHIELIKNIVSPAPSAHDFDVQYTQVMRLFEKYHDRGWVEKDSTGSGKPLFSFHAKGLLALIDSMVHLDRQLPVSEVLFTQSFLDSYKDYIINVVFNEDSIDHNDRQSINDIFSPSYLIKQQMKIIDQGIQDLEYRIKESDKLLAYIDSHKGKTAQDMVDALPSEFSYRMSYLKPFREWLGNLPDRLLEHEFNTGFETRNKGYYKKNLNHLKGLKQFYEDACEATP